MNYRQSTGFSDSRKLNCLSSILFVFFYYFQPVNSTCMLNIPTSVLPVVLRNYFISKIAHWPHDSKIIVFLKTIWKLRVFPSLTVAFFSSAEEIVRTLIPSSLLPDPSTLINALIWINGEATCNGYSRRSYWRKWSSLEYCILGSGPCRTKMDHLTAEKMVLETVIEDLYVW